MIRSSILAAVVAASIAPAVQAQEAEVAPPPRLVVALAVDQLSANLFNQYRSRFTSGLKTLADQGLVYANGYQAHAMTETCPGHATILTGKHPSAAGIPANDWIDRSTGREVYCLEDRSVHLAHGDDTTDNGPVSPAQLGATTLGDWLKARDPQTRVYAVSGKDRGAINLAGHAGDGVFWYTVGFGFTTWVEDGQTAQARLAPVADLNTRIAARPEVRTPAWTYQHDQCRALAADWPIGDAVFHSDLPPQRLALDSSPTLDELTLEAAEHLLDTQDLGARASTDVLGVSLSATDRIGHAFGTQGPEMCEQMLRLDAALGRFLERLSRVPGGVVLVMTADHGGSDFPTRSASRGQPLARPSDPDLLTRLNTVLKARFNLIVDPLKPGASGLMVVGEGGVGLPQAQREPIAQAAVELMRAEAAVAGAWTQGEVLASPMPPADADPMELSLLQRNRLGVVAERSPDILFALQPGMASRGRVGGTLSGHGSPWDYDRRVPIVFWTKGQTLGQERFLPIRTVDIAPTLANLLAVDAPDDLQGRCLDLGLFAAARCPAL